MLNTIEQKTNIFSYISFSQKEHCFVLSFLLAPTTSKQEKTYTNAEETNKNQQTTTQAWHHHLHLRTYLNLCTRQNIALCIFQ